jgi:hypothetical protein
VFDRLNGEFHNIMNGLNEQAFDDSTNKRVHEFWKEGDELFLRRIPPFLQIKSMD